MDAEGYVRLVITFYEVWPMRSSLSALLLTAAVAAAPAVVHAQAVHDPAKIEGGTFNVDPEHTNIVFGVNHFGFSTYYGRFAQPTGSLKLSPKTPAASTFDISVPSASINTPNDTLTAELKSAAWLDVGGFPTITFHSVSVKPTGTGHADVTGDLTLHGVTKPVTLHVSLVGAGPNPFFKVYTVGFQAAGTIKRSDFGVTKYLPAIGDDVTLILSAAFTSATPPS